MEREKITVIYAPKAVKSIKKIADYISEQGYPQRAEIFSERLYDFGETLSLFPDKYKLCIHPKLVKHNMRCAVFLSNYIFIYKLIKNELIIFNVIHARTNPKSFVA